MTSKITLPKSLLWFFLTYRWPAKLAILATALMAAVFGAAGPLFQKIFVDRLLGSESFERWFEALVFIDPTGAIAAAFVCTLMAQALSLAANYLCVKEGAVLQEIVSEELYKKMLSIRPDSMGKTTIGEVVSLYATDVPGASAIIDHVGPMATNIIFNMLIAPLAVVMVAPIPLGPTLAVMGVLVCLIFLLSARQSRFFAKYKRLAAERTGIVNEWIQTIRLLRILGWVESFERKIFNKRIEETKNRVGMVTNGQLMNAFGTSINFVINLLAVSSLIYLSGVKPTPGELLALLWIFGIYLGRPLRQLPWFFTHFLDAVTSMKRLEKFLERPSDAGEIEAPRNDETLKGASLKVRGLNLRIGDQEILSDVNFDVQEGEFVAVVGEVGSGKSMLALSLVGETGATFREFKIGDVDALKLSLHERRRYFGFVPQEGFVMSASLAENIVFEYEPQYDHEEKVRTSLKAAQFHLENEIQEKSGIRAEIGERGVNLSGGQRQRVSLARVHQFDRPIMLLDDCLSAVDVDTERQLLENLFNGEWKNRTKILVTHRLSVLNVVDSVFLMEGGKIVDSGPFEELLERSDRMREFVASVLRSEERSPVEKLETTAEPMDEDSEGGADVQAESVS